MPKGPCVAVEQQRTLPSVDDVLGHLAGATQFSKLDGFWQVRAVTFAHNIYHSRYQFNKLPSSAPERRMNRILDGLDGVVCAHFWRRQKTTWQAQYSRDWSRRKWPLMEPFEKTSMIDQDGIRPDPDKTAALTKMQPGNRAKTVHGFGESTGRIAEISQPLRELLRSNITWIWGQSQQLRM